MDFVCEDGKHAGDWHSSVVLADFINQVSCLLEIIDIIKTPQLGRFDANTINRAMGWGSYIEEVVNSLSVEWQREMLAQALASGSTSGKPVATLAQLRQARRWVLSSLLSSAFLVDHPKASALLKWAMAEYAELSYCDASTSDEYEVRDKTGRTRSKPLLPFVVDAADVMRSSAYTAVLSHAYSALVACAPWKPVDGSQGTSSVMYPSFASGDGRLRTSRRIKTCQSCSSDPRRAGKRHRPPSLYETSVETAQKRAYASNCVNAIEQRTKREEDALASRQESSLSFITGVAKLARNDPIVMEIMCFMLLEPYRKISHQQGQYLHKWVREEDSSTHHSEEQGGGPPTATRALLNQVLTFRNRGLWSLNAWLLAEVSHSYLLFADAYLAYLLGELLRIFQNELDTGCHERQEVLPADLNERLATLASRSARLSDLCRRALTSSNFPRSEIVEALDGLRLPSAPSAQSP